MTEAERYAKLVWSVRDKAGISQADLAKKVGISKRTLQNWEAGISRPDGKDILDLYAACGVNFESSLYEYLYPSAFEALDITTADEKQLREAMLTIVQGMSVPELRSLLYLYYGNHGSAPFAVLQELLANLHLPLINRVSVCNVVSSSYDIATATGTIVDPSGVQPDIVILHHALQAGHEAAASGQNGYTAAAPGEGL